MSLKVKNASMIGVAVGAVSGILASFVLSVESLLLASNKSAILSCNLNDAINCATVANHWSAAPLGFPSSFIGMMVFPVVLAIAVIIAIGVKLPRWFMLATQVGVTLGLLFATWMFYMSFFVIQTLCPWCLLTDLAMLLVFFGVTRFNVLNSNCFSSKINKKLLPFVKNGYDQLLLWTVVVAVVAAIIGRYGADLFA